MEGEAHRAILPAPPASRRRFPVAGSGESLPRGPQNVKEQARERRTRTILPHVRGTATFIFTFIFPLDSPPTTRNTQKGNGEELNGCKKAQKAQRGKAATQGKMDRAGGKPKRQRKDWQRNVWQRNKAANFVSRSSADHSSGLASKKRTVKSCHIVNCF